MATESISIGNELKDSYSSTIKWVNNGINWLSDIEEFYRERANIELEYSNKLKELSQKFFEKKAKKSASISVGDEPQITPGSLECASVVMWNEVLTQTENMAKERAKLSGEFNHTIGDKILMINNKCTKLVKHVDSVNEFLVTEKQKMEDEVNKSKKAYDSLCQSTETARQKHERSRNEKNEHKLEAKKVEMNIGKNAYLIKINIANRLKDKYYYQDIPEALDYLQSVNESRVGLLNKILKNASIVERNSNDRIKERLNAIDSVIAQNDPKLDVAMYVKHNSYDWKEPADFYFIPSSIWHDDESLVVSDAELTELQRRFQITSSDYPALEDTCLQAKQKLEELEEERKKDTIESITLNFDSKLDNSISYLQKFLAADNARVKCEVEIDVIQNYAGDKDLTYHAPQKEKKRLFGFRRSTKKGNGDAASVTDAHSVHTVLSHSSGRFSKSGLFNLRSSKSNGQEGSSNGDAKALYAFEASGSDEVSIIPGEVISVVDQDDGSGWTMIRNSSGNEGLVPSSYIEITSSASLKKKKGPAVAPKRGAKKVTYLEALYDYIADGEDEITIHTGDRIALVEEDLDGSGWTQGELNGKVGMFPTSYVKKL